LLRVTAESTPPDLHTNNVAGIVSMLVCQALFVANDALVKLATTSLPATEIMALRGLVASAIVAAATHRTGALFRHHLYGSRRVLLRSVLEALVALTYLVALAHIPLPTIITILQATPLILVAASGVLLGEHVGWRRWTAVSVGFIGVVAVVRPGTGSFDYVWLALLTVIFMAARDLITRRIHAGIPSSIVTLMTTGFVGLAGFIGAAFQDWKPLDATNAFYLVAAAVLVAAANHMLIRALRLGEISVVSPYRYSAIVWATALGVAIWGDVPDAWAFAGTALIVAAGIYTFHRETRVRRARG
jgi:drug/metabolite transporter (DMT)-like permease